MTKRAIMYLLTGPSHLMNAAVSMRSLRRHWTGDVLLYAWPESYDIAAKICYDPAIQAMPVPCDAIYRKRNAQEIAKISYIQNIEFYDEIVYLDADTLIAKPLNGLFDSIAASATQFVSTQFCDWRMNSIAQTRVKRLRGIPGISQTHVELSLRPDQPSYNSGIFACSPDSPVLPVWGDWTEKAKEVFISGEATLHPIAQKFPIVTLLNGTYNCSPQIKYQSPTLQDSDVAIWHFHGDCNVRPNKSPRGVRMWWPEFEATMEQNVGGIRDWVYDLPNRFLVELLEKSKQGLSVV